MQELLRKIRQILKDRKTRQFLARVVTSIAAVVVFVTTYALILPAISMEKTAVCGVEEHQHSDSCYEERLVCGQEESDGHHHDDSCYKTTTELNCVIPEHRHSAKEGCYDSDGNLICQLQEHVHDDSCYEEIRSLNCTLEESQGHHHTDACFEKVLVCGKEVHTHSGKCYEKGSSAGDTSDGVSDAVTSDPEDGGYTGDKGHTEDADAAETGLSDPDAAAEENQPDSYVPELEPLDMEAVLDSFTDLYYFHAEDEKAIPADSAEITDWRKVEEDNTLTSTDLVKMYLAYRIPGGSLNETNPSVRYRMPDNLHLSDGQIDAMNRYENGIAAGYRDFDAAEDQDQKEEEKENYYKYLGAEAVEGERRPDEQPADDAREFISAVVRAENIYDEKGQYIGQDLIFTFVPYSIDKNRNIYNSDEELISAGEEITGWFACDFRLDQIDWEQEIDEDKDSDENDNHDNESDGNPEYAARVIFAHENQIIQGDQEKEIREISRVLRMAQAIGKTEKTEEAEDTEQPEDIEETGENGDGASESAMTDAQEGTAAGEDQQEAKVFKSGSLTAEGEDYTITLDYSKEAKIPEKASLSVREITPETDKEAYEACLEQAGQQVAADEKTSVDTKATRFFDIEIIAAEKDSDGTEKTVKIEPSAPVSVQIRINEKPESSVSQDRKAEQGEPTVLHFAEDGVEKIDSTVTDTVTDSQKSSQDNSAEEQKREIRFEAESFSIYGVIYTVDLRFQVNGKDYLISVNYGPDAQIPQDAELAVEEITEGLSAHGKSYEEYVTSTENALGMEEGSSEYIRLFEISIMKDGEKIQPAEGSSVDVRIQLADSSSESLNVVHFADGAEEGEKVQSSTENGENGSVVEFQADGFSVYSIVGTVIEKNVLASDGKNYKVTVTYGAETGIPEGAELEVSEILPPESDETIAGSEEPLDSSLYDEYVARTEDALGWAEGSASYVRLFDIKITDEYGNKIDIAAPVDVRIELADKDSSEEGLLGTQVVHFADGAEVPDVVQNLSFDETKTESEGMTLSFTAAGFSVYAIVDAPEPAVVEIDYVDSLEELAGQTGKEFYLSYGTPPKYFTNELNTNSAFIENTSSGQADGWYFEPTGVDNQYYIYTYVEGVKKYITNPSGNLAGLADTNGTKFDLEDAGNGKFYFKKAGASLWLQHSGSGSGIRFYTDNKNAANSQISIAYASSFVLPDDPYGLNGKTYGIAYHNDTATSAALTAEGVTTSGQQRLKGLDMLMRPDVLDHDGILLVAENSDIQEWTFQNVSEDKYYLKTTVDGVTKYLTINGNNVTLMDTPDETYSLIKAIPGTGANSGKWHFSVGNYSLNFNNTANNGFNGTTGTGATTWMNLVEKSSFPEEDFTYYNAKKVSVSDTSQVPDKKQVIIYTRVWNDTKKKYEFFAIDHDGSLIPCYDTGDGIEWIGTNVNTALWELTEGTNPDGSLSYYYWLRNTQYGNTFITPQLSNDQVIYTSPGSDVQDLNASVNLNGRRYEENYTTIIRWDDDQYGYSGLKVENGHLVPCALSETEDFYFAIMEEKQHAEDVTTVETVDSKAYGITMKMVDFNNDVQKYSTGDRDVVQTEVMGTPDGGAGLLSTCLDPVTGYPVVNSNSNSLSQLFDSTKEMDANHLFLQNIYNESGYFEYDSTQNFAHLNPDGTFTVYDQLGAITGDAEHKTTREHGQFMPYNDISPDKGYAYDKDGHIITNQTDVLAHELPDTNARKGENLYLIGNNKKGMRDTTGDGVDYFFGMELEASFTQTANGLDAWGHDIIFEFSGDDDFWLYVDGQLVLDLGGVHSAQVGSVNFRTGLITSSNGNSTLYNTFKNNYKDQHPEATDEEVNQYLDDIFERNEEGNYVFKDYTKHTMRMFYMERGAGASNLHMRFNLAAVKPGTVVLSKQLSGTNSGSNSLLEYPYQIYYKIRGDGESEEHLLNDPSKVTYKDSTKQVKYEEHLTLEQQTYDNVFFLKAGESAVIELPEDTVNYRIVECGISTATYDVVKANGETLAPTDTQNPGRKDYKTSLDTMTNRDTVLFDNHVKEGAMRTLSITKQLYDSNGQDRLHYDAAEGEQEDKTLFSYRLYLGNAFTSEDDIPPANLYSYFVKNRDGYYCRWDLAQKKFVSLGIRDYSVLETYLATLTDTQKESIIFKTSPSGAISKIPADYTVEVRDLIDGVHWKVEERDDEIPKGYTLRLSDGYTRTDIIPEEQHGTTPISDTITGVEDPKVDVRNQKGWGLTVQKVWTDEDFIDHDPIYFAVYYEKAEQAPELIEGSVRSMMNGNKEIYYFFNQEQMAGRDFSEYRVYEVKLTNPEIDPQTGEIRYDSITPIPDNGQLTVVGRPKGTTESHEYEYTVTYQIGEPTTQNENVRTDVVTNSRPGIKLFKMLWNYTDPLAGSVFTLKDSKGQDVAAESYTSRSEDGLITIAYLNPGIYTLTEVETPKGYVVLPEPITITVAQDGTISVPVPNQYYKFTPAHEATETPEAEMATVTIRNRTTELHVKKVDAVTKDPLAGAHFALYNQVTDAQGNKRKDYQPITGYENLISNAEGILTFPDTNVEAVTIENLTWGNTYYLTETQAVTDYDLLKEDLCFTVNKDGTITIENAEHSGWLTTSTDTDKGKYSSLIQIPNGKLQYVSVWKTDDGYTTITTGASFALYKAEDYDDAAGRPKEGAVPVLTGTTGANGILALGTLPAGTEYRLVETKAPDGYYPPTSAIKIFVNADKVTAMQAGSPAKVFRKGDEHWVPDQPEATWQIRVWNSQGYALPSTGGPGTNLIYLIGLMLTGIAGAGLVMRKRRRT